MPNFQNIGRREPEDYLSRAYRLWSLDRPKYSIANDSRAEPCLFPLRVFTVPARCVCYHCIAERWKWTKWCVVRYPSYTCLENNDWPTREIDLTKKGKERQKDVIRTGIATNHLFVRLSDFLKSKWTRVGEWLEYMEQPI